MQLTSVSTVFRWPWPNWASAFADAQFGVINNQQRLSSNHHPQHLAPPPHITTVPTSPPSPTATAAHSRHRLPTNMAHDHQWQRGNATSLATMTRTDNPKTTKKAREWMQTTPLLTNTGQHPRTDTGDDEPRWDSSPPPLDFSDSKSRCHITVSEVATRRQTMLSFVVIVRTPRWAPFIPYSSQSTLLRHMTTRG